jgi:peptidoglycan/LPS O-acetylase OafA/YrhL/predicted ATP-grasp superfamily ATP-dependent carboligase
MNRSFSIYLDLVRVVSALLVVLYHSNLRLLSTDKLPLSNHGHAAVIVFFVLSGYVISHIASTRENTPLDYWSSRLSRFYSLALPTVLLTPLLDQAGAAMAPQFYDGATTHGLAWLRVLTSLSFLNEVWFLSIMSFSNVPYWSLCYEFWYYVLFAAVSFTAGRKRLLLCGAIALLLGPKILVLAPVWAAGVALHRWTWLRRVRPLPGAALVLVSWLAYGLFHQYGLTELGSQWLRQMIGERWHHQMAFSKFFLTDYLLAVIVACNFVGVRALSAQLEAPLRLLEPAIRPLAAYSFTTYLLHQPLILFYAALFNADPATPYFYAVTMLATLASIFLIGVVTEGRRHHWRRIIRAWLARLIPGQATASAATAAPPSPASPPSPAPPTSPTSPALPTLPASPASPVSPVSTTAPNLPASPIPSDQPLLPAVVLGIDTPIGLAIIRDLGRRGVPVYGIARGEGAIGLSSRHLLRGMLRAGGGAAGVIAQLRQLSAEIGPACLFAIAETDIAALNQARDQLPDYRMMFPDEERMERVLHKDKTYAAAGPVGLHVPRTWHPASMDEVARRAPGLRYPVVLKWADPNGMMGPLRLAGLALDKVRYCDDANALAACLRRYEPLGVYPMVQEYCGGYGLGQFILMRGGQPLYQFQHRRLHEWPPEGGTSTLCVSLPPQQHAELMRQSVALLRALDWEGVAMVEYRYDPDTGQAALMEVNGRFWGSLPLACRAGASFPWYCYQALGLRREAVATAPYRAGVRCRFMIADTKRLLHLLLRRGGGGAGARTQALKVSRLGELAGYLLEFLRPSACYFVHDWRDPKPLWHDLSHSLLQRLRDQGYRAGKKV